MKRTAMFVSVIVILAMLLTSCAPPTPQVIEKEKIVEKVVTQVVKEEVKVVETQWSRWRRRLKWSSRRRLNLRRSSR